MSNDAAAHELGHQFELPDMDCEEVAGSFVSLFSVTLVPSSSFQETVSTVDAAAKVVQTAEV